MHSFNSNTVPTAANQTASASLDLREAKRTGISQWSSQVGWYRPFQVILEFWREEWVEFCQEEEVVEEVSHPNKQQVQKHEGVKTPDVFEDRDQRGA